MNHERQHDEERTDRVAAEQGPRPGRVPHLLRRGGAQPQGGRGLDADLGPFGTSVEGDDRVLLPALTDALAAALASGATRVTLQLERLEGADETHGADGTPGGGA